MHLSNKRVYTFEYYLILEKKNLDGLKTKNYNLDYHI